MTSEGFALFAAWDQNYGSQDSRSLGHSGFTRAPGLPGEVECGNCWALPARPPCSSECRLRCPGFRIASFLAFKASALAPPLLFTHYCLNIISERHLPVLKYRLHPLGGSEVLTKEQERWARRADVSAPSFQQLASFLLLGLSFPHSDPKALPL